MKLATQYSQLENRRHGFVSGALIHNGISRSSTASFLELSQTHWQATDQSHNLPLPLTPWLTICTRWSGSGVRLAIAVPRAWTYAAHTKSMNICCTHRDCARVASRSLLNHCLHGPQESMRPFMCLDSLLSCSRAFWFLLSLSRQGKLKKTHHNVDPWRYLMLWGPQAW